MSKETMSSVTPGMASKHSAAQPGTVIGGIDQGNLTNKQSTHVINHIPIPFDDPPKTKSSSGSKS